MEDNRSFLKGTILTNLVLKTILWCCSFLIFLFLFSKSSSPSKIDYIYTSFFIINLFFPVCLNLYWLVPTYLKKEKYLLFSLLFILNLIIFAELNSFLFELFVNTFFNDYFFISYHNTLEVYFIFFVFFVLTILMKLAKNWVYLNQLENKKLKIKNQQIEKQLHYLKGQINPHFLFNSLNVLYALSIEKKQEVTNAILQLSEILRYVIYDLDLKKISIHKEVELIKNYIEFEKNRHVPNSNIEFNYSINDNLEIYPMLLLPLLENSFKHGLKSGVSNPYINIKLKATSKKLDFQISNNFKEKINSDFKGIGLKNIQENLTVVYPEKYHLLIENKSTVFTVNLTIYLEK